MSRSLEYYPALASSARPQGLRGLLAYGDLLKNFAHKDIQVRYQGAALGFLWPLINPFVMIALSIFAFSDIFKSALPHALLSPMAGLLYWDLFSQIRGQSSDTLRAYAGILKKMYFPRLLVPIFAAPFNGAPWLLAIAVHWEPDALLADEILAVGDANFQKQCRDKIARLRWRRMSRVPVSHNERQVRDFCNSFARLKIRPRRRIRRLQGLGPTRALMIIIT